MFLLPVRLSARQASRYYARPYTARNRAGRKNILYADSPQAAGVSNPQDESTYYHHKLHSPARKWYELNNDKLRPLVKQIFDESREFERKKEKGYWGFPTGIVLILCANHFRKRDEDVFDAVFIRPSCARAMLSPSCIMFSIDTETSFILFVSSEI